jgi:4-hydroxythreonine-4-phosphate dehydrogenase
VVISCGHPTPIPRSRTNRNNPLLIISTGCPAGIGPEVSVRAAAQWRGCARILVGEEATLLAAADLVGVPRSKFRRLTDVSAPLRNGLYIVAAGPVLAPIDRKSEPTATAGAAQLAYIETGYEWAKRYNVPLVTAPVSKAAVVGSGLRRARGFRGHTEWLQTLDHASTVTMCFVGKKLASALVTTHLPLKSVPRAITPDNVSQTTRHLAELLRRLGHKKPHVAVASLNPHAGESKLLGDEEASAIVPGILDAKKKLSAKAAVSGPIGAETAFRRALAGHFAGVVAMYHDQATIPMKLVDFGDAVNVTMGLTIVRTSVDHGTAHDIAWRGVADSAAMKRAIEVAERLRRSRL